MNSDLHHLYSIERQQRLQAEARAHGASRRLSARIWLARRRAGERPDAATPAPSPVGDPVMRGC